MDTDSSHHETIRRRAYDKWLKAGAPPSDGLAYWLDAESELRQELWGSETQTAGQDNVSGGITTSGRDGVPDKEQIIGSRG